MAVYTILSAAPAGLDPATYLASGSSRTSTAATRLVYTTTPRASVVIDGAGFAFGAGGAATGGTISKVTLRDPGLGQDHVTITGLAVPLVTFLAAWNGTDDPLAVLLAGNDSAVGLGRDDLLFGHDGTDSLSGGNGNDILAPGRGADSIAGGGGGGDILSYASDYDDPAVNKGITIALTGTSVTDPWGFIDKFSGIEGVRGTRHGDKITGTAGNNRFEGLEGADTFIGGDGIDTVSYALDAAYGGMAGVTVLLGAGFAQDGFGGFDSLTGIEIAEGSAMADTLVGGDAALAGGATYTLIGGEGNDTLLAGMAGALLRPGAGNDTVLGGIGFDEVSYDEYGGVAGTVFDFVAGTITMNGSSEADTVGDVEAARMTGAPDVFIGNGADNVIAGLAGGDEIDGGGGTDEARYDLDATFGGKNGVLVDLAADFAVDGFFATDTLTSIEVVRGTNSASVVVPGISDWLAGSDGAEVFRGLGGIDYIDGRGGSDTADHSLDAAAGGTAGILASLADGFATDGFGASDLLISIENVIGTNGAQPGLAGIGDIILGSASANRLEGRGGNDVLMGLEGQDTLVGGAGNDSLTGGADADLFVIDGAALEAGGYDQIVDFVPGTDLLRMPLETQGKLVMVAASGQVTLLFDMPGGVYALGVGGAATTAQVEAALSFG